MALIKHSDMRELYNRLFVDLGYLIERSPLMDNKIVVYKRSVYFGFERQRVISICDTNKELNNVLTFLGIKNRRVD